MDHKKTLPTDEKMHLFDRPGSLTILLQGMYALAVALFCLDFFIEKHPYFPYEGWFGFYAVFGFTSCTALMLVARFLFRPLVMRRPPDTSGENAHD